MAIATVLVGPPALLPYKYYKPRVTCFIILLNYFYWALVSFLSGVALAVADGKASLNAF